MTIARPDQIESQRPGWGGVATIAVLAIVVIVAAGVAVERLVRHHHDSVALAGHTADPSPIAITIAGADLAIPGNMIRNSRQRHAGKAERVDLLLDWPGLEGYSDETAGDFRNGSPLAPLIYVSIMPTDSPLDSTGRLKPVYSRFFTGETVPGPSGLVGKSLSDDSGYRGEQVFFTPEGDRPYVARCIAKATPEVPATCIRDVLIAPGLSMQYRFDRFYLGDWQEMDAGVARLATSFLRR